MIQFNRLYIFGYADGKPFKESVFITDEKIKTPYFDIQIQKTEDSLNLMLNTDKQLWIMDCVLTAAYSFTAQTRVLINGYQSWSMSGDYPASSRPEKLSPAFKNLVGGAGDYFFYKPYTDKNNRHSHWYTALYEPGNEPRKYWLASQDERTGYTVFEIDAKNKEIHIHKDRRGAVTSGRIYLYRLQFGAFAEDEFMDGFIRMRDNAKPVSGWTSWYYHYTKISEQVILHNLKQFEENKIPAGIFQIDDGWQTCTGDWLTVNDKFPQGMKFLADKIKEAGHTPGLWLAPFIAAETSELFKNRKELFITQDDEKPLRAGFNPGWGSLAKADYYALDIYNPKTEAYLKEVFHTVLNEWGFEMVKLDFLFAAGMLARGNKARSETMFDAMKLLRRLCGNKLILGCGVPISPASGNVDFCRIGADIGLSWEMGIAKSIGLHERISTVNSLRNTINRRMLSLRSFQNDPDVFILRDEKNRLGKNEKRTLFTLNLLFGDLVFTSDDIGNYSPQTMALYRMQFPFRKQKIHSVVTENEMYFIEFSTLYGRFMYIANLSQRKRKLNLEKIKNALLLETKNVLKPHEGIMIPIRDASLPIQIVKSEMHLFPGSEFDEVAPYRDGGILKLNPQVKNPGRVWFIEQSGFSDFNVDEQPSGMENINGITVRYFDFK